MRCCKGSPQPPSAGAPFVLQGVTRWGTRFVTRQKAASQESRAGAVPCACLQDPCLKGMEHACGGGQAAAALLAYPAQGKWTCTCFLYFADLLSSCSRRQAVDILLCDRRSGLCCMLASHLCMAGAVGCVLHAGHTQMCSRLCVCCMCCMLIRTFLFVCDCRLCSSVSG